MTVCVMEKFDFETMKQFFLERSSRVPKMQNKLVKKLGHFWFQKMSAEEWASYQDTYVSRVDGILSRQDLFDFINRDRQVYDMFNLPQIKFYMVPDYEGGKSAIVIKMHQCLTDGQGLATLMQNFNTDYESSAMPAMRNTSKCYWLFIALISPLLLVWVLALFLCYNFQRGTSTIRKDNDQSGTKTCGYFSGFDLSKVKEYCRQHSCTINDYMVSLMNVSLNEFIDAEKARATENGEKVYEKPTSSRFVVYYSFRNAVANAKDVVLNNVEIGWIPYSCQFSSSFSKALEDTKRQYDSNKASLAPFGWKAIQAFSCSMPYWFSQAILDFYMCKLTGMLSSLHCSTKHYVFDGKKCVDHFHSTGGFREIPQTFIFSTVGDRLSFCVGSDAVLMKDPQVFCDMLARNNEIALKNNQ